MNAKEIRIGNYVEVTGYIAKVVSVSGKEGGSVEVRTSTNELLQVNISDVNPIPLTGDILMSCCKFDKAGRHVIGIDAHRHYLQLKNGYVALLNNKYEDMIQFWDVQTLHQLQNLYFALKGEEMVAVF